MGPADIKDSKVNRALSTKAKEEGKIIDKALITLNLQVALFRDLLLDVGGSKDGPALREKVRRVRMGTVEAVIRTNKTLLPHIKNCLSEGSIIDNGPLVCLYLFSMLLERELEKCLKLVTSLPIQGMDKYFESKSQKPGTSGIGTMVTQIALCNPVKPDFNVEEAASVRKNKNELMTVLEDMAEHLPKENPSKAMNGLTCHELDRRNWTIRRKERKCPKLGLSCFGWS